MLPTLMIRDGSSAVRPAGARGARLDEPEGRLEIEVEHLVPRRVREALQRLAPRRARVVDEDVQPIEVCGDEVGEANAFVVPGEIRWNGRHLTELGQLLLRVRARIGLA